MSLADTGPRVAEHLLQLTAPVTGEGIYRACNIPLGTSLRVVASGADSGREAVLQSAIDSGMARFLDIVIGDGTTRLVTGHVLDANHKAVSGAHVNLMGTTRTATTDENGAFRMPEVRTGTHMVEVVSLGYEPHRVRMDVGQDADSVAVVMSRKAVLLDSVKILAIGRPPVPLNIRRFEDRRKEGNGYFATAQQIADMHVISSDEIMRRVPGVQVIVKRTRSGDSTVIASRRGRITLGKDAKGNDSGSMCPMDVYIDGRWSDVSDIQMVPPSMIYGIEVHGVSTSPIEYHASSCGEVLIWTK